ncbi:hypothetical protein JQL36_31920 [Burkholderia diffusa]|nr:hypothetical protein [Burkholderia diffusa]
MAPGIVTHANQGSRFASDDWQSFLKAQQMVPRMSRRGNCPDNALAEGFFSALKKDRTELRNYPMRAMTSTDMFNYVEMFYELRSSARFRCRPATR